MHNVLEIKLNVLLKKSIDFCFIFLYMALKYILLLLLLLLLLQVNYSWGSQAPSLVYECQIFWEDEG